MPAYSFISRNKCRVVSASVCDDQTIKRVARPSLIQRIFDDSSEGEPTDRQADLRRQTLDNLQRGCSRPFDLVKQLKFKHHRGRYQDLLRFPNSCGCGFTELVGLAAKKPHHDTGIEVRHFSSFHSLSQSMRRTSSESPTK